MESKLPVFEFISCQEVTVKSEPELSPENLPVKEEPEYYDYFEEYNKHESNILLENGSKQTKISIKKEDIMNEEEEPVVNDTLNDADTFEEYGEENSNILLKNSSRIWVKEEIIIKNDTNEEGVLRKTKEAKCKICKQVFLEYCELKKHEKFHTRTSKKFISIQSLSNLKKNGLIITKIKIHECTKCQKTFQSSWNLKRHVSRNCETNKKEMKPTIETPFKCNTCHKYFKRAWHLKRHALIHTEMKKYECNQCHKTFHSMWNLKRHELIHFEFLEPEINNGKEILYRCATCEKAFRSLYDLKRHNSVHSKVKNQVRLAEEKSYNCVACQKSFKRFWELKRHESSHSGEKPFKCKECNVAYSQSRYLWDHKRICSRKSYK